jgi:hypothetical protein
MRSGDDLSKVRYWIKFSKLDRTFPLLRRGVTRPRTLKCASLASPRRLSTKCPTSAFLISAPQSHKSRKSSRARFSTLFSCAIRRAALAWYCAFPVVLHVRVSRQAYRHGAGLFSSKLYRAGIFRFWSGNVSVSRARLF